MFIHLYIDIVVFYVLYCVYLHESTYRNNFPRCTFLITHFLIIEQFVFLWEKQVHRTFYTHTRTCAWPRQRRGPISVHAYIMSSYLMQTPADRSPRVEMCLNRRGNKNFEKRPIVTVRAEGAATAPARRGGDSPDGFDFSTSPRVLSRLGGILWAL